MVTVYIPVTNPLPGGKVTSPYGPRDLAGGSFHDGIDEVYIDSAHSCGRPILSPFDSVITAAYPNVGEVAGRHPSGWALYVAHLDQTWVKPRRQVKRGQQIGTCGARGNVVPAGACHVHYMNFTPSGNHVDPLPALQRGYIGEKPEEEAMRAEVTEYVHVHKTARCVVAARFRSRPVVDPSTVLEVQEAATTFALYARGKGKDGRVWYLTATSLGAGKGVHIGWIAEEALDLKTMRDVLGLTEDQAKARERAAADAVLEAAKGAAARFGAS